MIYLLLLASGWSTTKDAVAKVGHTYVIWTWENHLPRFAFQISLMIGVVFDWAYQIVEGERQLKPSVMGKRKSLDKQWSR